MKAFKTTLFSLSKDRFLRNDEKYHKMLISGADNIFSTSIKENIRLSEVIQEDYTDFSYDDDIVYKGVPTGQTYIDEDGDIVDFQPVTKDDHPGRLKYSVNSDNILISSLRLAKSPALMFKNMDLSKYVFSNGFYIFKVKNGWNKKFVLYMLRSKRIKQLLDNNIYRGIGISAYRVDDLLSCSVKKVSAEAQTIALKRIESIEIQVRELKSKLLSPQDIMNDVFIQEFGIDLSALQSIDSCRTINLKFSEFKQNNVNVRFSYRWNKARLIQERLISMVDCCKSLGKYIIKAKNGWSPECDDNATSYKVLSLDALSADTNLNLSCVKASDVENKDIEQFTINNEDFLVSRGNGSDELVGLASIVHIQEEQESLIIYPDIMIRVELSEEIDKQYLAYMMNSSLGRLFFKYVSKGSNKKKITPLELEQFVLPLPEIKRQQSIVSEIKAIFEIQTEIKDKIASLRKEIDKIIEETIAECVEEK